MPSNRGPQSAGYAGATHQERLTTTTGSTTTTWTNSPLGETNTSTGSGSSLVSYVRDPSGQLIGIRVGTSTQATRYYFTFDGLGSITGLTDSTGARVNTYRYDPYGQLLSSTEGLPQPFRYTGGIHDSATGLTKLGIRYYDPTHGRFTQPDPTGQDPHYTYARNSPCSYTDRSGSRSEFEERGGRYDNLAVLDACTGGAAIGAALSAPVALPASSAGLAPGLALAGTAALAGCAQGAILEMAGQRLPRPYGDYLRVGAALRDVRTGLRSLL
jgi:RHS repeat-associated protein